MDKQNKFESDMVFSIEEETMDEILHWVTDVAGIDVEHLRSCLVAGSGLCDLCLSLSAYYKENLDECRRLIEDGKGDPIINEKRLSLLEIGERSNNLSGYLALLQMDAMMSLINMLEAKSDVERLLICKHAYTIIYDAKIKGLFRVVSKEMRELPESVLPTERREELWRGISKINRMLLSEEETERVRNNIDAHKSSSFTEQIAAYKQCHFGKCVASMFALIKIAWFIQETLVVVQQNLNVLEKQFEDLVRERIKKMEELRTVLEAKVLKADLRDEYTYTREIKALNRKSGVS